jgi:Protein of unknown function (DUF3891)
MLITRRGDRLKLFTHPDHGRLAGQLGERWGNERFATPVPHQALVQAATHHDDGWHELDDQPAYNEEARRPAHFLELPLSVTIGPYGRGVDSVYARDPYAGALVSMHWAGLYSARWGVVDGSPLSQPAAAEVVAEQERRWVAALRDTWDYTGLRSEFETDTWHAYEVLQALDYVALAVGLLDLEHPTDQGEPAVPMQVSLPHVDQPPGARLLPAVPLGPGREHIEIRLWVAEPGRVVLDPYPFGDSRFWVEIPARGLDDRPYTADESARAFRKAPVAPIRVAITAAD